MSQSYMTFPHFLIFSICRKLFGWYVCVCTREGRRGREGRDVPEGESAWQQSHWVWVCVRSLQHGRGSRQPPLPGAALCADLI